MQLEHVDAVTARWPDPPEAKEVTGPLAGLRVLDLTAYAVGPWAAANLSQLGADVVRVNPPYGDPIRAVMPRKNGQPTTYMSTSLGKRSMVLDLKDPDDHALVLRLAAAADVVLENSRAGAMDRLGLGYETLSATNPRLVYCSSSSFGDVGPMAPMGSTDPQGQAFSGFASLNGRVGGQPEVLRYVALVDLGTSLQLLNAVLVALVARRRTGLGQHLRTSQMEAAIGLQTTRFAEYFASGEPGTPLGSGSPTIVPSRAFRAADNVWVTVSAPTKMAWAALVRVMSLPKQLADLASMRQRAEQREAVDAAVAAAVATRPAGWWTTVLPREGVACVRLRTLDEKPVDQVHMAENGLVQRVRHPIEGTLTVAGPMWQFERTPARLGEPELPGAHTQELVEQLRRVPPEVRLMTTTTRTTVPPAGVGDALVGLRVLDLTQGVAGPYCSLLLATLGAEVVRVEPPQGDWLRTVAGPSVEGTSAAAHQLGRGKRSVVLDLDDPEGDAALRRLLTTSDVLLHDLTSARAQARGLAPADLRSLNPDLVDVSVTPFGERGPWGELPATELEVQATTGVWRYLGVIGEEPMRIGADLAGIFGGCAAFQAVMATLAGDDSRGQHVATSELAAVTGGDTVMIAALDDPDTWEGFHTNAASYPPDHGIATRDGRLYYGQPLRSEEAWVEFCHEIGADALLDVPMFATRQERMPNQMSLRRALQPYFEQLSTEEIVEKVVRSDGIAVPIHDLGQVASHPQIEALSLVVAAEGISVLGPPWRAADGSIRPLTGRAAALGADTRCVLLERGFTPDEVDHLTLLAELPDRVTAPHATAPSVVQGEPA